MDTQLRSFNGDIHTKEAVIAFIHNYIDKEGLRRMYAKEDVSAVADARFFIDGAFEQLSMDYGITTKQENHTNQAR